MDNCENNELNRSHDKTLIMMRGASFDQKRDSSINDDISSMNSDFVQPRFRPKKNHSQNNSGSQLSESDLGSDESSEMEVLSEDE